ncbi:MAG: spore germination protein [Oscillospiraceae bacterium]|nr:spore germination protein [Oscillospiraceae bacterium]
MEYPNEISCANVKQVFADAADLVVRPIKIGDVSVTAFFIDGLTAGSEIAEYVLQPMSQALHGTEEEVYAQCLDGTVYSAVAKEAADMENLCLLLVNGFCVVVFDSIGKAVAFEAKTGEKRSPAAPEVENTIKGPKDAFTETNRTNTSLVRRHLRSPFLRIYEMQVGKRSQTNVSLLWLDGITDPDLVQRMKKRLSEIDVDGFLSPAAVEEYVTGSRSTAFPLLQYTQRTDKFSRGLLDGRVGLIVDGLPQGYLAPAELTGFLSSPEDQGMDHISASLVRVLRYGALLISLLLPALYVAMAAFHQEMIPTKLLLSIIESKKQVPFPTIFEVIGILLAFEILQEAGIHLPQSLGQTVSIIGGLVVGSAAVEAKIISPAALIVVAVAGICGYSIPGRELAGAVRVWRLGLTAAASVAGLFGMTVGLLALLLHLAGLESFGLSYLRPFDRAQTGGAVLRRRLIKEKFRDPALGVEDLRRQK